MSLVEYFFPKRIDSGETKDNGLGHAFVWAYKDNDQDGEPDWADPASGESEELTEVLGKQMKMDIFLLSG